jgi:hypothetical protein
MKIYIFVSNSARFWLKNVRFFDASVFAGASTRQAILDA